MKLKSPLDVCQILQKCGEEGHQDVRIVGARDSSVSTSRLLLAVLCPQLARLLARESSETAEEEVLVILMPDFDVAELRRLLHWALHLQSESYTVSAALYSLLDLTSTIQLQEIKVESTFEVLEPKIVDEKYLINFDNEEDKYVGHDEDDGSESDDEDRDSMDEDFVVKPKVKINFKKKEKDQDKKPKTPGKKGRPLSSTKTWTCPDCGHISYGKNSHEKHRHTEHPDAPTLRLACTLCGKVCLQRNMELHMRILHTNEGEDPAPCPICGAAIKDRKLLFMHVKRHGQESRVKVS